MADIERFSKPLEHLRSGVYIVTSAYRNSPAGCTCVWVTRVSFKPPLIAVNLEPGCHTFLTIERGKRFCVNVVSEMDLLLARRFGFTSGHEVKKFRDVGYHRGQSGSPVLDSAVSYLDCKLHGIFKVGDHRMVVGELIDAAIQGDEEPMIYEPRDFYTEPTPRLMEHSSG